ncbi:MAG: DinB family protein [Bacteroidota bacterium]|nr:DinB family protein [Bacteroidota bacterium]
MKEQLLSTLENSRNYTLAVADAMPANLYNTHPSEGVWTFRELLHHIAYGIQWWEDNYIRGNKTEWNPPEPGNDKRQVLEYLHAAYDSLKTTLDKGKLAGDAIKGFHATIDHITHHRGQAVLHLRCQGITPPEYGY